jgi:hypothetical protein|tara:strand:- start:26 stop:151 length:126 start_codon:yes stop_codon:yes gene_type:complete
MHMGLLGKIKNKLLGGTIGNEAALVRAVGGIVTHAFFDWWK